MKAEGDLKNYPLNLYLGDLTVAILIQIYRFLKELL